MSNETKTMRLYNIKYPIYGKGYNPKLIDKLATYISIDSRANWTWSGDRRMIRSKSINSAFYYRSQTTSGGGCVVYEIIGDSKEDIEVYLEFLISEGIDHTNIDKPERFHN